MNPRIHLVSQPKEQMAVGPALTVKARGGDNLALHAALNIAQEGDFIVVSNEEDDTRSLMGEIMMAYLRYDRKIVVSFLTDRSVTSMKSVSGISGILHRHNTGRPVQRGSGRSERTGILRRSQRKPG